MTPPNQVNGFLVVKNVNEVDSGSDWSLPQRKQRAGCWLPVDNAYRIQTDGWLKTALDERLKKNILIQMVTNLLY